MLVAGAPVRRLVKWQIEHDRRGGRSECLGRLPLLLYQRSHELLVRVLEHRDLVSLALHGCLREVDLCRLQLVV